MDYFSFLDQKPDRTLYHYTGQEGLLGILNQRCLWASNINFLNDRRQFRQALQLIEEEAGGMNARGAFHYDFFERASRIIHENPCPYLFVFSLTEEGDSLSQWRTYCREGGGFSVGFDFAGFDAAVRLHGFSLLRCVYDPDLMKMLARKVFEEYDLKYALAHEGGGGLSEVVLSEFLGKVLKTATGFKDPLFGDEKEWRLAGFFRSRNEPNIKVRPGPRQPLPFCELKLGDKRRSLQVREVIVGPAPEMELALDAVSQALLGAGWDKVWSIPSRIPYRTW